MLQLNSVCSTDSASAQALGAWQVLDQACRLHSLTPLLSAFPMLDQHIIARQSWHTSIPQATGARSSLPMKLQDEVR